MSLKKVVVLFGGASNEHEVSLRSAACVLKNIDRERFEPIPVGITRAGEWLYYPGEIQNIEDGTWYKRPSCEKAMISPDRVNGGLIKVDMKGVMSKIEIDAVFPVLHGKNGEDGSIQGLLQLADIPYVGCDVMGSALCMDKAYFNEAMDYHSIPHCEWVSFTAAERYRLTQIAADFEKKVGYPIIVKPARAGSSVGVSKVKTRAELSDAVDEALRHDDKVLLERCVNGREIECAVLGNSELLVSGVGEILPPEGVIYTYDEKYSSASATGLAIPADIPAELESEIRDLAAKAYKAAGCRGLSRVDFFVENGRPLINEINTLPGFTSISMYPKLMERAGLSVGEVITRLLELCMEDR